MSTNLATEIDRLEREAVRALERGDDLTAGERWQRVAALAPDHPHAWTQLGQLAFRAGQFASARGFFEKAAQVSPKDPQRWINVALASREERNDAAEEAAIARALSLDPTDLMGLLMRGELRDKQGKRHEAARAFGAAASVSPALDRLFPALRPAVERAMAYHDEYQRDFARFLDGHIRATMALHSAQVSERMQTSLDILAGRKRRFESQPSFFHVAGLLPIEFFDRALFPWLDAFEAQTDAIRNEFLAVLREDAGFEPYIKYAADVPVGQWAELNHDPRWSAYHLLKGGEPVAAHAAKCPLTMSLLSTVPAPQQAGRTPVAMFSVLKPNTRIPPHTGASNARLVTHVPLIIPPGCALRVGNTVREWKLGHGWAFDDTIEHEAWNNSDQLRVVLIFDTWHPHLSEDERHTISAMATAVKDFLGEVPDSDI